MKMMEAQERTKRLRKLMKKHKLDASDIGRLLGREAQTVRSWACEYPERTIPAPMLELLELKLK
jgi:hypothetical protein